MLGLLAWLVLSGGCLALLRAGGSSTAWREVALLLFLAFLPAASSAIVQLYHPQDMVSLGLSAGGLALALRRRWVAAGVLFGIAILTKQFAILILLPAVAAAPLVRFRLHILGGAAIAFSVGILAVPLGRAPGHSDQRQRVRRGWSGSRIHRAQLVACVGRRGVGRGP